MHRARSAEHAAVAARATFESRFLEAEARAEPDIPKVVVHGLSVDANISRWNKIWEAHGQGQPGEPRPGQLALLGSHIARKSCVLVFRA